MQNPEMNRLREYQEQKQYPLESVKSEIQNRATSQNGQNTPKQQNYKEYAKSQEQAENEPQEYLPRQDVALKKYHSQNAHQKPDQMFDTQDNQSKQQQQSNLLSSKKEIPNRNTHHSLQEEQEQATQNVIEHLDINQNSQQKEEKQGSIESAESVQKWEQINLGEQFSQHFKQPTCKPQPRRSTHVYEETIEQDNEEGDEQQDEGPKISFVKVNSGLEKKLSNPYQSFKASSQRFQRVSCYSYRQSMVNDVSQRIVCEGRIFKRTAMSWEEVQSAVLTKTDFLGDSVNKITKVKVKKEPNYEKHFFMKVTTNNTQDQIYSVESQLQLKWFKGIIWTKLSPIKKKLDMLGSFIGKIEGQILKRSQYFKKWEERYIVIDKSGLKSFKGNSKTPTMHIPKFQQLWTRFETLEKDRYLVMKGMAKGVKYEFGIPAKDAMTWVQALYSIM